MALELRSHVDAMKETDDHNVAVVKDLQDKNKDLEKTINKLTRTKKAQRTWQLKTTNHVRRQKTSIKNMNSTIDAMETDYTELKTETDALKTETDALKTVNDTLETEIATLHLDNERNTEDFETLTKRLSDHSCPYCGTPGPSTSSTGTQTPVTINKHFMG